MCHASVALTVNLVLLSYGTYFHLFITFSIFSSGVKIIISKISEIDVREPRVPIVPMSNDEGPPPAVSGHVRPKKNNKSRFNEKKRPEIGDPRFESTFGSTDVRHFDQNYKFLREMQEEEENQRRFRIRCLKCYIRRIELEAENADLEEYDLSETEREVFGDGHMAELAELKRTPANDVYAELLRLQRESQLYVSRNKDTKAKSRQSAVRTALIKKEVDAIKQGVKSKPYFPKRSQVKRAVLADTFDSLERQGGKIAVDKYLLSKKKKK